MTTSENDLSGLCRFKIHSLIIAERLRALEGVRVETVGARELACVLLALDYEVREVGDGELLKRVNGLRATYTDAFLPDVATSAEEDLKYRFERARAGRALQPKQDDSEIEFVLFDKSKGHTLGNMFGTDRKGYRALEVATAQDIEFITDFYRKRKSRFQKK